MSDEGIESAKIDPNQQIKSQQASEEVSRSSFLLFSYLYLIQGVVIGLIGTMPYIYPHLPDIETMALFNSISLPYSFKFLIGKSSPTKHLSYRSFPSSNTVKGRHGLS